MPGSVRVGDLCIGTHESSCSCDGATLVGVFITGSPTVFTNNLAQVRVGDLFVVNCNDHPIGIALTGSPDVFENNIQEHRVGDTCDYICGSGVAITGSGDVFSN